jgi:hypothetical protein
MMGVSMKLFIAIVMTLILVGIGSAETYSLGSHNVSLNLSVPFNCTNEPPMYNADSNKWSYVMKITPSTGGFAIITLDEMSIPDYSDASIRKFAESVNDYCKEIGIGDMKYGMTTYREHDAFEYSYPAQKTWKDDKITGVYPEFYCLRYHLDELTDVMVQTVNTGEVVYSEILGFLNVTKTTKEWKS